MIFFCYNSCREFALFQVEVKEFVKVTVKLTVNTNATVNIKETLIQKATAIQNYCL